MNLLSRLAVLVFALALLPGAPAHAHAVAGVSTAAAPTAVERHVPPPCHQAPATTADMDLHHGHDRPAGTASAGDCCADGDGTHPCGPACACPSAAPALAGSANAVPTATPFNRPQARGSVARGGPAPAPPNRPPIG